MRENLELIMQCESVQPTAKAIDEVTRQSRLERFGPRAVPCAQRLEAQGDVGISFERRCDVRVLRPEDRSRSAAGAARPSVHYLAGVCAVAVLLIFTGCATTSERGSSAAAGIPDRPEKLEFPPLEYEPPDPREYRVPLESGPVAYVLEDRELPLVNISVLAHTGDYLDPEGKEGVASLTGYLLSRGGTKSWTAEELEERLAFLAANLSSGVGDSQGSVNLNLLSKDLDEGLSILREVLAEPRFQEDKITLRKQQMLQAMQQRNDESAAIEARERSILAHGEDFYLNDFTTSNSVAAISRDDLRTFHRNWFHPSNFVLAVNGDFDREAMIEKLEKLFADWPYSGKQPPPVPTNTDMAAPGIYVVDKDVNQGRVSIQLPGIMRDNPDYFAVMLMNDILGGGGFTSRIMNRVRSDEGLAYSAGSSFPGGVYYPSAFRAGFQSKSRTVPYAISIVLEEMTKMREELVSEEELNTARDGLIDRFPRSFAAKEQVVGTFASDEFTGRFESDPDYWDTFRDNVRSVTREDIQLVARKYLKPDEAVILVVGLESEILLGHPNHPVQLKELSDGPYVRVPLRDPMTMEPMTEQGAD